MARRYLVAGNWKMHGLAEDLGEVRTIAQEAAGLQDVDCALCLPATLIERAVRAAPAFPIGGQDVHQAEKGAHTGCVSAAMLRDSGAVLAIVGHSERREAQKESDSDVRAKAEAALGSGLQVILCVGESLEVRESGAAVETVERQLLASLPESIGEASGFAVAYEPIWAIGTGKVASVGDIDEMHRAIRRRLVERFGDEGRAVRILYGGSVKASNADEIFAVEDVDGALVGGASLKAADFLPIVRSAAGAARAG